jgi:hypothetical protein
MYVHALCAASVKHVCSLCDYAYVQPLLVYLALNYAVIQQKCRLRDMCSKLSRCQGHAIVACNKLDWKIDRYSGSFYQ